MSQEFAVHHLAREAEDPGEADVQVGQDAGLAAGDHVVAQAGEIAGAGAADVEPGRGAGAACQPVRVDAQRGSARVDVGMEVDHSGHHDRTRQVAGDHRIRIERRAHGSDLAVVEGDVGDAVEIAAGIDHPRPAQQEVVAQRSPPRSLADPR